MIKKSLRAYITWYKVVTDGDSDTRGITAGNSYDLAIVNNYVVHAKETEASSTDILVVTDYETGSNSMAGSTTQTVKAYFLDGSSKNITVEKLAKAGNQDEADVKFGTNAITANDVNKLYTYSVRSNGNYTLKALDSNNKAGYETVDTATGSNNAVASDKVGGKYINDSAVVFALYMNNDAHGTPASVGSNNVYDNVKVLTGKVANDWASAYGTTAHYATKKSNGLETVRVLVVIGNGKYSGAGSDYKYAYLTADPYNTKDGENNDQSTVFEAWTGSENVSLKTDGTVRTSLQAGDILMYTNDGDKFITVENNSDIVKVKAAITGIDKVKEGKVSFSFVNGSVQTYKMDEDCVFLAVNDDKQEGMEGSSMDQVALAEEYTDANNNKFYYANAWVVYDESDASDKRIVAVIYDADNNRLDNGNISIAK